MQSLSRIDQTASGYIAAMGVVCCREILVNLTAWRETTEIVDKFVILNTIAPCNQIGRKYCNKKKTKEYESYRKKKNALKQLNGSEQLSAEQLIRLCLYN